MLGWPRVGGCSAEGHRGNGERPPQHPLRSLQSAVQWHRQCPPSISQSLACCRLHLLRFSPCLLTTRLQSRLLQELPPWFLAARRLYVRRKGEAAVGNAWEQAWTPVRLSRPSLCPGSSLSSCLLVLQPYSCTWAPSALWEKG